MIIIDASIALKWYLHDHHSNAAINLLSGSEKIFAADTIGRDVTSGLLRAFRQDKIQYSDIRTFYSQWQNTLTDGSITLLPTAHLEQQAFDMAVTLQHHLMDCYSLVLAKDLGYKLITADDGFHRRARPAYGQTFLLAEYTNIAAQ